MTDNDNRLLDNRLLEGKSFRRSTAGQNILDRIGGWDVWTCEGPEFRNDYDRAVRLYVHEGRASLAFADGETADLQPGDTMTIRSGARAVWAISQPIRNSYTYRDTQ